MSQGIPQIRYTTFQFSEQYIASDNTYCQWVSGFCFVEVEYTKCVSSWKSNKERLLMAQSHRQAKWRGVLTVKLEMNLLRKSGFWIWCFSKSPNTSWDSLPRILSNIYINTHWILKLVICLSETTTTIAVQRHRMPQKWSITRRCGMTTHAASLKTKQLGFWGPDLS